MASALEVLCETSSAFKAWRRRASESLASPMASPAVGDVKAAKREAAAQEALQLLDELRCEVLEGGDDLDDDESELAAARIELEASLARLDAAETARATAELAMDARSRGLGEKIDDCSTICLGDVKTDPTEDLAGISVAECRREGPHLHVLVDLGNVRLALVLLEATMRLASAHVSHPVIDVADLLDAARREAPPDDLRLVVAETRARLRQLAARADLAAQLQSDAVRVHANDLYDRLTLVSRTWTAVVKLPRFYPDHPPHTAPRLHSLEIASLTAHVDSIRRDLDAALLDGADIKDVLADLDGTLRASDTPSRITTSS